jgi:hypothetical protein
MHNSHAGLRRRRKRMFGKYTSEKQEESEVEIRKNIQQEILKVNSFFNLFFVLAHGN